MLDISISSVELCEGLKTVLEQVAAEALDVPFETVVLHNDDTDTGPYCTGTFASRTTHRAGNAIIAAAQELREVMLEEAAELLDAAPGDLVTDGKGDVRVQQRFWAVSHRRRSVFGSAARPRPGRSRVGGSSSRQRARSTRDTGAVDRDSTESHACTITKVEVDTETAR